MNLRDIKLLGKSALVQYVDDLLIASKDEDACIKDTIHLCTALAEKGHQRPSKLQLCQKEVKYLGFILREGQFTVGLDDLKGLFQPIRFCDSAWGLEREQAFKTIKGALASAPALGLPDYTKPFNLHVREQKGIASGVITQKLGPHHRPVTNYSTQLDPVAAGAPACNKSVAAAAAILEKSHPLILGHPVTVYVPHEVEILLKQYATQALSPQRAHSKPRIDLTDVPLQNPDLALFVDGSSYYLHGQRQTGYAVVSQGQVIEAEPLPSRLSAQGAELVALTHAAHLGKGKRVNIYTDSRYAFRVCHATGMIWKERGFFTSSGKRVSNGEEIHNLLESVQLPKEIAVIHCPAHTKDTT
ncbi:hypothetical protein QYF61_004495 [Mycteria americana]|uniref:RNase H type-1 domain-containing protein n=1 Tax=Mycteria americana TaxID=33587 RepID=A0AAN7N8E1_MYCAM|nr:hypothetical protein QYF61_004495 [Mycteria americana]